ncbi:hypothetical protein SDC9_152702 [bioreactor metagenome]|uniref:Uncharacterized protein n=1 Tax=bioreactor metagenome TaxID=1076179 RepID=A0A645EW46_9ZZZZ
MPPRQIDVEHTAGHKPLIAQLDKIPALSLIGVKRHCHRSRRRCRSQQAGAGIILVQVLDTPVDAVVGSDPGITVIRVVALVDAVQVRSGTVAVVTEQTAVTMLDADPVGADVPAILDARTSDGCLALTVGGTPPGTRDTPTRTAPQCRLAGDHIHHATACVRTVQRGHRTTHDLDALHIFHRKQVQVAAAVLARPPLPVHQ